MGTANITEYFSVRLRLLWLRYVNRHRVRQQREELVRIRHDYTDQLSTLLGLLQAGHYGDAEQTLQQLLGRVERTRELPYCGIPVVNVILSQKEALCHPLGIRLQAELMLPDSRGIALADLCSIFSNLLDNAIRACQALGPGQVIRLRACTQGDFVIIRCDNPCPAHPMPGKSGRGLEILRAVADRWHGSFRTQIIRGQFVARVVLMGRDSADFAG